MNTQHTPGVRPAPAADEPMPGTRVATCEPFPGYDGPPYVLLDELPIRTHYTKTVMPGGAPPRETPGYGPQVHGDGLRAFLAGSLRGWLLSEATVTSNGTIYYRQSKHYAVIRLEPNPDSGTVVHHPERQILAAAYRVTEDGAAPEVWSRGAVRLIVTDCITPGVIDWPRGRAHLTDSGIVHFTPSSPPWSRPPQWVAEPVPAPQWGPPCTNCGCTEDEHEAPRATTTNFRYRITHNIRRCTTFRPRP